MNNPKSAEVDSGGSGAVFDISLPQNNIYNFKKYKSSAKKSGLQQDQHQHYH